MDYVREEGVDCDLWVGDTLDVPITAEVADKAREIFERYQVAGGNVDLIKVTHDPGEAAKLSRIKGARACYAWSAATLQPWKLTAAIMRRNLQKGLDFNLQTWTTVRKVVPSPSSSSSSSSSSHRDHASSSWVVQSDRGEIECARVVHATNAYSAAVEPSLLGLVWPTPHLCNKVVPPGSFAGSRALRNSYGVLLPDDGLISINPRCTADGIVMFGGSSPGQKAFDAWLEQQPPGRRADDSFSGVAVVTDVVRDFADRELEGWGDAVAGPGQLYDYSWSGIIGRSLDGVPLIGELPGLPGQWVCVGHNGHGMARTFTAAPGLVGLMAGRSWRDVGLPDPYQLTAERLSKLNAIKKGNAA